jgi:hypothetical protein
MWTKARKKQSVAEDLKKLLEGE